MINVYEICKECREKRRQQEKEFAEWMEANKSNPRFHVLYIAPMPGRREDMKCALREAVKP